MHSKKLSYYIGFSMIIGCFCFPACQKSYYENSGLQTGIFQENSLQFLQKDTFFFDSLVTVINLAGMNAVIADSTVTFFAPTNHAIAKAMNVLNGIQYNNFEDSLRLQDVPASVWRKFLSRYIFRGKYMLKDIPRYDATQPNVYPGMNLKSWDGYIMNLGVQFSDWEGTKNVGPRQVLLREIGDMANPKNITTPVATSDLQTSNGVIHVLDDTHTFGFSAADFANTAEQYLH